MISPSMFLPFVISLSILSGNDHPPLHAPPIVPPAGAGFTEAVFDAATLNEIMSDGNCASLRFYNAMLDGSSAASVMVVGVKADGEDIHGSFLNHAYKMAVGLADDHAVIDGQTRGNAGRACGNIATGGADSFSASFAKADVMALLHQPGCNGIRVTPDQANGSTSMKLSAVTIARSAATELGSGPGFELVCGDPCPAFCGSPLSNYVNDELIPKK